MDWNGILNGAFGAGLLAILLKLFDLYATRNSRMADAANTIAEGGAQAVKAVRELLADYDKANDELKAELAQREKQSQENQQRLADLEQKNKDQGAALNKLQAQAKETDERIQRDTEETQRLRADYAVALKQIIRLEDLAIGLGEYVDTILTAVKKSGVEIPLNGGLMESVLRLKAERALRQKK